MIGVVILNLSNKPCSYLFKNIAVCVFSLLFFKSAEGVTAYQSNPTPVTEQVESLIHNILPNASVGIMLQEAETGEVLYERRAQELFTPASIVKLFTAAASLLSLGPDYRFETAIQVDQNILPQARVNNLYVYFSGDPSLTRDDLKQLIVKIKASGIREISGNIIVDNTHFRTPNYAMGWSWDSLAWYYAAPITSIILNENQVPIRLNTSRLGEKAEVICESKECEGIHLHTEVISVSENEAETNCQIQVDMNQQNTLNLKGCWPYRTTPTTLRVALKEPYALAEKLILETLKDENIKLDGKIMVGTIPSDLKIIASHYSKPLSELLKNVLQNSNNIYADSLLKTLGVKEFQQGTFQAGIRALKAILSKPTSIDFEALRLLDGSGASRYNLITPQQMARLLLTMYHDKKVGGDFQKTLAISGGEEGNLSKRMNSLDAQGRILAKTGSMVNISALAGYLRTQTNKNLIFVIMIDHVIEGREKLKAFEDELCHLFVSSH